MNQQIQLAAERCRAAFAAAPAATHAWCCHHEVLREKLHEPAERRIAYILSDKPSAEQEVRLNNFRPVLDMERFAPASKAYYEAYDEAIALARKAYGEAIALASKAYCEAIAPASKAYDEAIALVRKAYDEAIAPANKAYDEAIALASKAYYEVVALAQKSSGLLDIYLEEVPGGTWTGTSVFC